MNKVYDCIVVGGGISGASFAHYLNQNKVGSILLLEKGKNLGGRVHSLKIEGESDSWREMGAHTCYNSYTELINIIKESGYADRILPVSSLPYVLYSHKKIRSVVSEISFLSIAVHFWRYFTSDKAGKTTREYFEPIVGQSNYKRLFSKLFRAVISQEANDYPAEIFLKKRAGKEESVARRFSYQGGLSQLIVDLVKASGAEVLTSTHVAQIEKTAEGYFLVKASCGGSYLSKNIAIATDISAVPLFLNQVGQTEASDLLANIRPSASVAVNLLVGKDKLTLKKVAGIIPLSDEFFSAVSRDAIDDQLWRNFTFHFPVSQESPSERLETAFHVLNIKDESRVQVEVYHHVLPAMRLADLGLQDRVDPQLQGSGIYLLGNYFSGMSLEDCVRRSKQEAERFKKK